MIEKIDYEVILGAKKERGFRVDNPLRMGGIGVDILPGFFNRPAALNQALARKLMEETRVYKLLQGYRGKPPADLPMLEQIILSFSNLITDFPEIAEMDINPIAFPTADPSPSTRASSSPNNTSGPQAHPHLIISPYPTKYVTHWRLSDRDVLLRPVRPEDGRLSTRC